VPRTAHPRTFSLTEPRKMISMDHHARTVVFMAFFLISLSPAYAEPHIHFAPAENLEHIDVSLIKRAQHSIDIAAYTMTDVPIMEALADTARRGVTVRILLDAGQLYDRPGSKPTVAMQALQAVPGVSIHYKPAGRPLMHLKAYQIDGKWLRTGSANFTASGLKQQDNDLLVIDSPSTIAAFQTTFERLWHANSHR